MVPTQNDPGVSINLTLLESRKARLEELADHREAGAGDSESGLDLSPESAGVCAGGEVIFLGVESGEAEGGGDDDNDAEGEHDCHGCAAANGEDLQLVDEKERKKEDDDVAGDVPDCVGLPEEESIDLSYNCLGVFIAEEWVEDALEGGALEDRNNCERNHGQDCED